MADILKFTETPLIDESIEEYEYHEYEFITGTNLNNGGDIRISMESQDVFTHPSESYLIFEGRLTKANGTAYANAYEVALTNNAIMHLFSRIEYHLSNQLIESLNYPGQATTMLGLQKYPDDFSKANNEYMGTEFDPTKDSKFISYLDDNNLYGWAMSNNFQRFEWMTDDELNDWKHLSCFLEVDLEYPKDLHDLHNDYPLALERVRIGNVEKLIPNLKNNTNYVVHYENLK